MQLFIHHCAQFEGDIWWNIQPMQFIMRDVHQILIELLCTGGDLGTAFRTYCGSVVIALGALMSSALLS